MIGLISFGKVLGFGIILTITFGIYELIINRGENLGTAIGAGIILTMLVMIIMVAIMVAIKLITL